MYIEFKSLKFRNLLSYGNKLTTIDFHKGLNLIKAQNGSGKSSILDALNFVLFGKPFRNIKMNQLINKYNDKDLLVSVEFNIGNDEYEIIRGLKPNLFSLRKNGNEVDSLSSKKLNQEEIDKLLGINEKLFKNIVGIAVTNNKPFLSMSTGEKRMLIENIFNIDVLSEMNKEIKKRNTCEKTEQKLKITELDGYKNSIIDNQKYIKQINGYIDQFEENKAKEIANKTSELKENEEKIAKKIANIDIGNKKLEELTKNIIKIDEEKMTEISKTIGISEHERTRIKKTLSTIGQNKICPICNSELDEGHAKEHIDGLKEDLNKIENFVLPKLNSELKELENIKQEKIKNDRTIDVIKSKLIEEETNKKSIEKQIEKIKSEIKEIENKECNFSIQEYEEKLASLKDKEQKLNEEVEVLNHNLEINEVLLNILGDEGMKKYFFEKLLPILNQRINFYLKKFELPAELEFNNMMEEKIMTGKFEQSYNQFSGGERARIDMAILLSFFDISKIISNWSCSILFIDEVLDAGVDASGTEHFISTLYNIVTEDDRSLGIYLISHKLGEIQMNWNEVIEIEKKNMFSNLKIVK